MIFCHLQWIMLRTTLCDIWQESIRGPYNFNEQGTSEYTGFENVGNIKKGFSVFPQVQVKTEDL